MRKSIKTLILMITGMLFTHNLYAAGLVSDESLNQSSDQTQGNYPAQNMAVQWLHFVAPETPS